MTNPTLSFSFTNRIEADRLPHGKTYGYLSGDELSLDGSKSLLIPSHFAGPRGTVRVIVTVDVPKGTIKVDSVE